MANQDSMDQDGARSTTDARPIHPKAAPDVRRQSFERSRDEMDEQSDSTGSGTDRNSSYDRSSDRSSDRSTDRSTSRSPDSTSDRSSGGQQFQKDSGRSSDDSGAV